MDIPIIKETEDYVAINKPAGISVHGDGKADVYTIADWVLEHYPALARVGEPEEYNGVIIPRPGIVHRLDKETSGVLLIAKTDRVHRKLKSLFHDRFVKKHYTAIVHGHMRDPRGLIDKPIGRSSRDARIWTAGKDARGETRDAETIWRVVSSGKTYTLLSVFPQTGRTHQIRVHLKSIGHPVVGDTLYAPGKSFFPELPRMALHAKEIRFPWDGEEVLIEAPLPKDFADALAKVPFV